MYLRDAIKTGFIQIMAIDDLKTGARNVLLEDNLRFWIAITWAVMLRPDRVDSASALQRRPKAR